MTGRPPGVVIAGGGVAGLEPLLGLHALAPSRVALTPVAPEDEFVYRPLAPAEPYSVGRMRRVSLSDAAAHVGAVFVSSTVEAVDARARALSVTGHHAIEYKALVVAIGAEPMPVVPHALTGDDRSDAEVLGGLLRDIDEGF